MFSNLIEEIAAKLIIYENTPQTVAHTFLRLCNQVYTVCCQFSHFDLKVNAHHIFSAWILISLPVILLDNTYIVDCISARHGWIN